MRNNITQDRLKELFNYCPDTGIFTRIKVTGRKTKIGDVAGVTRKDGYKLIGIDKVQYLSHRLAWLYMYGEFPTDAIDHIDQNPSNNKIDNLRDVTSTKNQRNRKLCKNNTSGVHGVYWHKAGKKWCSKISINDKIIYLGLFVEFHEAVNARKNAEVLYGFHENHGKKDK